MQNNKIKLPLDIYSEHLKVIKGIRFTPREIDIIACILSGRSTKTIPSFLSISSKTVSTHLAKIRAKIGCFSRESLIDFVETSDKISLIKNEYYLSLSTQVSFEKQLRKTPKTGSVKTSHCLIVYEREQKERYSFIHYLEDHLKIAGIKTESKIKDTSKFFVNPFNEIDYQEADHILYVISEALIPHFQMNQNNSSSQEASSMAQKTLQTPTKLIFLLSEREEQVEGSKNFEEADHVDFSKQQNYYFSFSELLKRIQPSHKFDKIIEEFHQFCEEIYASSKVTSPHEAKISKIFPLEETKNKWINLLLFPKRRIARILMAMFLVICACCMLPFVFIKHNIRVIEGNNVNAIRSDLILPTESIFLDRQDLITQIEEAFKKQGSIQTVALVGIGGSGKTTVARQYARQQRANVIWEVNAETQESLKLSFESLAQALSKTEEDQRILRGLKEIQDFAEREEKIIQFVKVHLRSSSNWFLIYDNVEKFTDIEKYFPQDANTWGLGKIILTAQDHNLQNHKQVNYTLPIGKLDPTQKLNLFIKIMSNGAIPSFTSPQDAEVKKFLAEIPPFPLDISIAAYYLKATDVPYSKYLEYLSGYPKEDFENTQKVLLKESGDYTKTRYSIITLAIQKLIEAHKDFSGLLLFISFLDSQNIPRDLLNSYKGEMVVDNFIYHLKKYSLISNHSSSLPTISIHRSTQEISLAYLEKTLNLGEKHHLLSLISQTLENYIASAIKEEDLSKIELLVKQCEAFLSHKNFLIEDVKGSIGGALGSIYYYLCYDDKAKEILEESLAYLYKNYKKNHTRIAYYLVHLGAAYRELGSYEKAKKALNQSLFIHKNYLSGDRIELAEALIHLGVVYRVVGNYAKAKELLEQGLIVYKKYLPGDHVRIAWSLGHLGTIYDMLGDYEKARSLFEESLFIYNKRFSKNHTGTAQILGYLGVVYSNLGDYEKARTLLERTFIIYKDHLSENQGSLAEILTYLGDIYRELGNYEKSKELLEQSVVIYKKHLPEHKGIARSLAYLGNVYKELGNCKKAKRLLEKSLIMFENHYGKDHIETARILDNLGQVYLQEDNLETAYTLFQKALKIFQNINHPESYKSLENLAELNEQKARQTLNSRDRQQSESFKRQAINYLKQALKIVKNRFPESSPHIQRIQFKLKTMEQG